MKKSSAALVLVVAALAFLAAARSAARSDLTRLVAAAGKIEDQMEVVGSLTELGKTTLTLECCDSCDRRVPKFARCACEDIVRACHPACRKCVPLLGTIPTEYFVCDDMSYKACHRKCHDEPAALQSVIN
ncbi:uncharacterized protein A4U43_C05F2860 [Asparagus officinalis]|uniref:Bowman-Birk serine protease inhibitors family domain-containing protein n=1 Tax=Asparagus officinalis TaxID=4686 RepID=A0A5P1EPI7_ASPOF|nr:seed trypsin/chymotrypsin inhibitor TI5-72-like [Asparagus officinalis]ONK67704.1 uncharacterized protein A4U43_C05F2860 [Asparagus officinalis]